jgi:hypothetical protein
MKERCIGGRKHDWRKTGGVYNKKDGLRTTKRRCLRCGKVETL